MAIEGRHSGIASKTLIAGASGFVGGKLAAALAEAGARPRCLVRDPGRAKQLERDGSELHVADVTDAESLAGSGEGVDVAYYLVHAMAGGGGFAERERRGAATSPSGEGGRGRAGSSTSGASARRASRRTCAAATRPRGSSKPTARR